MKKGLAAYHFIDAATIRMMAAGAALMPLGLPNFKKVPAVQMKYVLLTGAIGMFFPAFLFCLAQQHITSTAAGILNALTPVFTFVFALLIFKLPFKPWQGLGILIGLLSSIFLILSRTGTGFTLNFYAILPVVATICYGMNVNISKEKLGNLPPMVIASTTVTVAGLMALFLVFIPRQLFFADFTYDFWPLAALVTLGMAGTALAQVLFLQLLAHTSSLFASSVTYLMPIVAIFWGVFDGEAFTWQYGLGICGILAGVLLIRKG